MPRIRNIGEATGMRWLPPQPASASARRIVLAYLAFGVSWILLGDWCVARGLTASELVGWLAVLKGLAFVFITAGLLYLLIRRRIVALQRAEARMRTQAEQQAAAAALGRLALHGAAPPEVMHKAAVVAAETLGADCACVAELVDGGQRLRIRAAAGPDGGEVGGVLDEVGEGTLGGLVVRGRREVRFDDLLGEKRFVVPACLMERGFRGGVIVPIHDQERLDGVVGVFSRAPARFAPEDVHFLASLASALGMAISRHAYKSSLEVSTQQLQRIVDRMPVMLARRDADLRIVWVNREWERVLGWTLEEAEGRVLLDELYPDPLERLRVEQHLRTASGEWGVFNVRVRDGRQLSITFSAIRLVDGSILLVGQDPRLKQLEDQLLQAQKMEALGQLAGGIAHDFNNILTAILGHVELTLATLDGNMPGLARVIDSLDQINRAGHRAANLTRQLLTFSRRQVTRPQVLDVNLILTDMKKLLQRLLGEDVELALDLDPQAMPVRIDAGQFEQVIMNLAVNARDAMPNGGKLLIETRLVPSQGAPDGAGQRPQLLIRVWDTGVGMTPETAAHIFEPFFTTKPAGKGTGLGLATSYGIVQQAGGRIDVDTHPGQGTCFRILLPCVAERPTSEPAAAEPHTGTAGGSETILLCEDDERVRNLAVAILSGAGYRVLAAEDGTRALEVAAAHAGRIDLLLTDLIMPGMNGRALADALQTARPDTPVLYISGYADDTIASRGVLEPGLEFLSKPFEPATLLRRIREVLDNAATRTERPLLSACSGD